MPDLEVAILDQEGRLVIPRSILEGMGLSIFANFRIACKGDTLTLTVIRPADRKLAWKNLLNQLDHMPKIPEKEFEVEFLEYKKERRRQQA